MKQQDYTAELNVNLSPMEVFDHINNIAAWWTYDLTGKSVKPGDEFTVRFGEIHVSTQKITESLPGKKVVWLVTDSKLNFTKDPSEWTGTSIIFEIFQEGNMTRLLFTHEGLNAELECFNGCTQGWDYYFKGSLHKLLTEGKGTPGLI